MLRPYGEVACSAVDGGHHCFGIALAGGSAVGGAFVDAAQVLRRQFYFQGADVFFQIFSALGSGNGDDVLALRQEPGQSQMAWGALFFLGDFFHGAYQCQVLLKIFSWESRRISPLVVWTKIFKSFYFSGQEATAQ